MDVGTQDYPLPNNEIERLRALSELNILGTETPELDAIVSLACKCFDVPVALVTLLDEHRQWLIARQGTSLLFTERASAFCNYPVASGQMFVVSDATLDPRFSLNRSSAEELNVRFYAGAPLLIEPGVSLGTLCIIDTKPRSLTEDEIIRLARLAEVVTALLHRNRDTTALTYAREDVADRTRQVVDASNQLARLKNLFDRASALTKLGAWEWNLADDDITWTDGMYDLHDLPRGSEIKPEQVHALYPHATHEELKGRLAKSLREKRGCTFEGAMTTAKGRRRWVRIVSELEQENGVAVRRYGIKQDITEQKAIWDRMRFLAECDPLTRLANRITLQKRIAKLRKDAAKGDTRTLLIVDVDGFKHVNDSFGHSVGDECLKRIAKRLRGACPEAELVARLGGDEFALLLDSLNPDVIEAVAKRLLEAVRRPVHWRGRSFQLSASMGIASSQANSTQRSSELFTEADLALYAAKAAGRNTFRCYSPEMSVRANERFEAIRTITKALAQGQLELFYQPKINLIRGDELAGFEALLRWRRPDGKVIAAGAFAAALADPELSDRIGEWVIREALDQASAWHREGLRFGHIAINLSSGQFRDPGFADILIADIASRGLQPDMIEVEVTESVLLDHGAGDVKGILLALKTAGVKIALDDFGTGYASLSHLRTYPVDIIKVDRSFVQHFLTSFQDHAIVQSTLFLARHLQLDVVAEGIEEEDQCEFLRALGCHYAQGYLFSKAVCAKEAAEWCSTVNGAVRAVA